jgi:hypothetical protein
MSELRLPSGEGRFPLYVYFVDDGLGFCQHVGNKSVLLA